MDCEALHCGKTEIKKVTEKKRFVCFWELCCENGSFTLVSGFPLLSPF